MRRIRIKGVNDMKEYAFGIDLGGTTAKVGLFTTSGKLLEKWEVSTDTSNNGAHILENLAAAVQQKMQEKGLSADEVEGVGLGVPGPVLDSSIVPIVCANLGGWGNRNVSIELSELLGGIRVLVGNDANVAALGEIWMGAAQGCRSAVMVTLGTGVGGGIIANGQLVRGVHFTAGEYSFVNTNAEAWDAPDQNMACQCSTSNLLKWYRARKALPEDAPLDGRSFFAAANAGEPEALEVLQRFCHAVAVQIYNLTVLLDVEKVAIGGGISKQPLLLESLRSAYNGLYASRAGQAYMEGLPRCQIVPCAFSSEANQVGVAAAYFEAMQKKR